MNQYLFVFMISLTSALIIVPFLRKWAVSIGTIDIPDARKIHTVAVPRNGGIAIFISFLFSLLVYADPEPASRGILAGALIIFITGLVDDFHSIPPLHKFLGQLSGCLMTMVIGSLYITNLGDIFGLGTIILPYWLAIPFTLFAVVGVINAVNLIDGLDGLAGGLSVIATGSFLILGWDSGNPGGMLMCAALLGAILGFLKYNYYPARIFMGDTGSLVVGFLLSFIAILLTQGEGSVNPVVPVLILGVPIIDTIWVMTSRLAKHQNPFAPDMTHVHHKFLNLGMEHRFTVIVIYGISLFWAVIGLLLHNAAEYLLLYTFLLGSLLFYLGLRYVIQNPQSFPWIKKDSPQSLRQTNLYLWLARATDYLMPLLMVLYVLYIASGSLAGNMDKNQYWWLNSLLLMFGIGLLAWTRNVRFSLVLVVFYIGNLVVAFNIETFNHRFGYELMPFDRQSNWLFVLMAALCIFKILFSRADELLLGGVELLSMGLAVFAGIVISNLTPSSDLLTVLFKGVLLILVFKTLIGYRAIYRRIAYCTTLLALLTGILQGVN